MEQDLKKIIYDFIRSNATNHADVIKELEKAFNRYIFASPEKIRNGEPVIYLQLPLKHFSDRLKERKIKPSELIKTIYAGYLKNRRIIDEIITKGEIGKKIIFEYDNLVIPLVTDEYIYCKWEHPVNPYMCITSIKKEYPKMRLVAKTIFYKTKIDEEIQNIMKKLLNEWNVIGYGSNSAVYDNPKYPFVIKIYRKTPSYEKSLQLIRDEFSESFPIIMKGPVNIKEDYSVIFLEKMEKVSRNEYERIIKEMINGSNDENIKNLYETLKCLFVYSKIDENLIDLNRLVFLKNKKGKIFLSDQIFSSGKKF